MICGGASCHHEKWNYDHPVQCQLPLVHPSYHIGHTCNDDKNNKKTEPPSGEVDLCETKLHFYKRYFLHLMPFARHCVVMHRSLKVFLAMACRDVFKHCQSIISSRL